MASFGQAQEHVCRSTHSPNQSADPSCAYLVCHGLSCDGQIILNRPESPEYSDPNRRRPKNSSSICGRTRLSTLVFGLFPDRIAIARPCRRYFRPETGVLGRTRYPRSYCQPGVRHSVGEYGYRDSTKSEGHQLRHYLWNQSFWISSPIRR